MYLKVMSAKWRQFCRWKNELNHYPYDCFRSSEATTYIKHDKMKQNVTLCMSKYFTHHFTLWWFLIWNDILYQELCTVIFHIGMQDSWSE